MNRFAACFVAVLVLGPTTTAVADDLLVKGERASLKGGGENAKKRKLEIVLKDDAIAPPFVDPTTGASLRIHTGVGEGRCSLDIPLAGKNWAPRGGAAGKKGYLFRGKPKRSHGITIVKLKPGKITLRGGGKHWPCELGADSQPLPLRVELRLGGESGQRICAAFGGTVKTNKKGRFRATSAVSPEACSVP